MNYLIGYAPDRGGADALAVGRMMARAGDVPLTVCVVTPETWGYPSPAAVDAEYKQFLGEYARKALAKARAFLGEEVKADYIAVTAASAAAGLSQAANERDAYMTILGSARDGRKMRAGLGTTASGVLAGTKYPTLMAPLGYAGQAPAALERVTCAYSDDRQGVATLAVAVDLVTWRTSSPTPGASRRRKRRRRRWRAFPRTSPPPARWAMARTGSGPSRRWDGCRGIFWWPGPTMRAASPLSCSAPPSPASCAMCMCPSWRWTDPVLPRRSGAARPASGA
ncbi:MAG: hypothetical protein B7Y84_05960 [Azorhizobium sp. 32-67-21]|nr:MAG: hypothetical protein B7Y84_05960 [Azorhizobium sp. 32-67-21]